MTVSDWMCLYVESEFHLVFQIIFLESLSIVCLV
jgi:hypothetical protein